MREPERENYSLPARLHVAGSKPKDRNEQSLYDTKLRSLDTDPSIDLQSEASTERALRMNREMEGIWG